MNNNWEPLIRAIVPLSFMAIWALTSLFNRDAKAKPIGRDDLQRPGPTPAARAGDPTLRWGGANTAGPSTIRPQTKRTLTRVFNDEGIMILSAENNRTGRDADRSALIPAGKRPAKGKPVVPPRKVEPAPPRARLAGVSQNVNQHLANTSLDMVPLATLAPATAMPSLGLSSAPTVTPDTFGVTPRTAAAQALRNPARLREAFILNEILNPPVAMRGRASGPHAG